MGQLFDTLLVHPIINILLGIYHVLFLLGVPFSLGFSIIILTILIRLILYPFTASQLKAAKKMQEITPHLNRIKDKHKNDAKRLQEETMRLYKEHGVNPAAGCLPIIIQLPVIWALYAVLQQIVRLKPEETVAKINSMAYADPLKLKAVWDTHFFGLPIGESPANLLSFNPHTFSINPVWLPVLLIPIATGVFQFIQSKMMLQPAAGAQPKTNKKESGSDFQAAMQTQSMYIFPLMIGFFSFNFPLGLSLYWNTFTIFGIIQQYKIQGLGGLESFISKKASVPVLPEPKGKKKS